MATIIRGSGIPALSGTAVASDVVKGKTFYNVDASEPRVGTREQVNTYTFPSGSGGTVDLGAQNLYRYVNASNVYNQGINAAHGTIGSCKQSSHRSSYGGGGYGSTIDTGNNHRKAVFVGGAQSGSGSTGGGQGSNNNSSWANIGTGISTYRYFRAWSECNDDSSSISYGYIGVIDLGY